MAGNIDNIDKKLVRVRWKIHQEASINYFENRPQLLGHKTLFLVGVFVGKSRWSRLLLSLLLLIAIVSLWTTRFDELMYHTVGQSELIDIGDAISFDEQREQIGPNTYVSVTGILGNKAATLNGLRAGSFRFGRYQVRHLLGSKLYIEYDEAKYHQRFSPFTRIVVKGRLVPFGPNSELEKVRRFFKDYYNQSIDDHAMLVVVDEMPRGELKYPLLFAISLAVLLMSFYSSWRGFKNNG